MLSTLAGTLGIEIGLRGVSVSAVLFRL